MRCRFAALLSLVGFTVSTAHFSGQSVDSSAKLQALLDATALDSKEAGSWHWKMDVTVYDVEGKNPKTGNIEVWRSNEGMRTVMNLEGAELTTLRIAGKLYRSAGDPEKFIPLDSAFMQVLNPIPSGLVDPSIKLKLNQRKKGQIKLDCVQPTFKMPDADTFSMDSPISFCSLADTDHFVVAYEANQTAIATGQLGAFGSKQIPIAFEISSLGHMNIEGKTTAMSSFTPTPDDFILKPNMQPIDLPISVPQKFLVPLTLIHDSPHYPAVAKSRHVQGEVKFDLLIGEDGRVVSHTLVGTADPDLSRVSEEALTHLIFRPYLINGVAVQVKTTLTTNFTFGP